MIAVSEEQALRPGLRQVPRLFGLLLSFNLAAWGWAFSAFHDRPALLGAAMLAWVFGLRHAVDADHLAAIDNVVRKLMQEGRCAESVGFWFSLGHSTVVVMASAAIAAFAVAAKGWLGHAREIGELAGTLISAIFLFAIAAANIFVLRAVWRDLRLARRVGPVRDVAPEGLPHGHGLLTRLFSPLFRAITQSWQMYPLGFLFGLGFDTATEIGVLGISATQAVQGISSWQAMVFPALFTAGMALIDTGDSVLMVHAYGWAFIDPLRKLWYNLTMTAVSVSAALLIGGVEVLGLLGSRFPSHGLFWRFVDGLGVSFGNLGFTVVGLFVLCWAGSVLAHRYRAPVRP